MLESFQVWWTVVIVIAFLGLLAWVLWPRNREKFRRYGQIPLRDDVLEEKD